MNLPTTPEVQSWIDAAAAAGGGTVDLPPGRMVLTQPLILKSHVTLRGSSTTGCVVQAAGSFSLVVVGEEPLAVVEGWTIEELTLAGRGAAANAGHGIEIRGDSRFGAVRHAWIRDMPLSGLACIGANVDILFTEHLAIGNSGDAAIVLKPRDAAASTGLFLSEIAVDRFGRSAPGAAGILLGARVNLSQIHLAAVRAGQTGIRFERGSDFSVVGSFYAGCSGGTPYSIVDGVAGVQVSTMAVQDLETA